MGKRLEMNPEPSVGPTQTCEMSFRDEEEALGYAQKAQELDPRYLPFCVTSKWGITERL